MKEAKEKKYVTYKAYVALISEKLARIYSGRSNKTVPRHQENVKTATVRSKFKSQNLASENIGFDFLFFGREK